MPKYLIHIDQIYYGNVEIFNYLYIPFKLKFIKSGDVIFDELVAWKNWVGKLNEFPDQQCDAPIYDFKNVNVAIGSIKTTSDVKEPETPLG